MNSAGNGRPGNAAPAKLGAAVRRDFTEADVDELRWASRILELVWWQQKLVPQIPGDFEGEVTVFFVLGQPQLAFIYQWNGNYDQGLAAAERLCGEGFCLNRASGQYNHGRDWFQVVPEKVGLTPAGEGRNGESG